MSSEEPDVDEFVDDEEPDFQDAEEIEIEFNEDET